MHQLPPWTFRGGGGGRRVHRVPPSQVRGRGRLDYVLQLRGGANLGGCSVALPQAGADAAAAHALPDSVADAIPHATHAVPDGGADGGADAVPHADCAHACAHPGLPSRAVP